jgi:hypothetical protein
MCVYIIHEREIHEEKLRAPDTARLQQRVQVCVFYFCLFCACMCVHIIHEREIGEEKLRAPDTERLLQRVQVFILTSFCFVSVCVCIHDINFILFCACMCVYT